MMMNPIPPMSKAYSLLQQDESQMEAHFSALNFSGNIAYFLVSPSLSNGNKTFSQKVNFESGRTNKPVS